MTQAVGAPWPPGTAESYDEWRDRRWKLTGRLIALLWLVAVLSVLLVEVVQQELRSGTYWEAGDWSVPGWPSLLIGPLWGATLLLVAGGPQPWRATRWAWFWNALAGPFVGVGAYVLLGGPLAAGQPTERTRRLTGGWGFLIAILVLGGFGAS